MSGANPPMPPSGDGWQGPGGFLQPTGRKLLPILKILPNPRAGRGADELSFLPAALEIIETPASPAGRAVLLTIAAALIVAIVWASIGKVNIIVSSQGRIEPAGNSKTIQPLQAGVVQAILVQSNQHVVVGQSLVVLDPTGPRADVAQSAYMLLQGELDQSRLLGLRHSLRTGEAPHLLDPPSDASGVQLEAARASMQAQYAGQGAKLAALDNQIAQQQEKNGEALASLSEVSATIAYATQMAAVRDKAMALGVGSKIDWINAHQQLSEQQHQIDVLHMQALEATAAAQALVAQRAQGAADYETSVLGDLVKAGQQIDQSRQDLSKAQNQLALTTLRAPIAGTVQEMNVHTIDGVVTPAQALMVIVPDNPILTAQVRIKNEDIGFVHVGQNVQLKIGAFDFTRYGSIPGTIIGISRDSEGALPLDSPSASGATQNQQNSTPTGSDAPPTDSGAGTYIANITLGRTTIMSEQGENRLQPGMQLTADIKTGRRTVMSYLLSPLSSHISQSMQER